MSAPTTGEFLNQTTPAAPTGDQTVIFQSDGATPLQSITAVPKRATGSLFGTVKPDGTSIVIASGVISAVAPGGAQLLTANYTAITTDSGTLLVFNSSSAVTLTLPATPPSAKWKVAVENIGAGVLTISRNGLLIDTAAANLTLNQNSGVGIYTDGTNYFTERGLATDISGLATKAAVQQESYIYAADTGAANAYVVALSPAPTIVAGSVVVFKAANANTGASTIAVNGGSATAIKKNGSTALAGGEIAAGQVVAIVSDGTNYQLIGAASAAVTPRSVGITIFGSDLTSAGLKDYIQVNFAGTIVGAAVEADVSGSASVDVWKKSGSVPPSAPSVPTSSNKISGSTPLAISSAQTSAYDAAALSGWSTLAIAQWDSIGFNLTGAVTTSTKVKFVIYIL